MKNRRTELKASLNLLRRIWKKDGKLNGKSDCCEIASLYDAHEPTDKYLVYSSLMHMTNNRLGIHISDESFIAFLIFKGLENKLSGSTQYGYME
jgi:hypothetical protein